MSVCALLLVTLLSCHALVASAQGVTSPEVAQPQIHADLSDVSFYEAAAWVTEQVFTQSYEQHKNKKRRSADEPFGVSDIAAASSKFVLNGFQYLKQRSVLPSESHGDKRKRAVEETSNIDQRIEENAQRDPDFDAELAKTFIREIKYYYKSGNIHKRDLYKLYSRNSALDGTNSTAKVTWFAKAARARKENPSTKKKRRTMRDLDSSEAQQSIISPFAGVDSAPDYRAPDTMQHPFAHLPILGTTPGYTVCDTSESDGPTTNDLMIALAYVKAIETARYIALIVCCALPESWGAREICDGITNGIAGTLSDIVTMSFDYSNACGDLQDYINQQWMLFYTRDMYEKAVETRRFQIEEALRDQVLVGSFMLPESAGGAFEMVYKTATTLINAMKSTFTDRDYGAVNQQLSICDNSSDYAAKYKALAKAYSLAAQLPVTASSKKRMMMNKRAQAEKKKEEL